MTVNRKIKLIPWDAESPEHLDRLVLQRIACGWQAECVPEWKKEQQDGNKMFHWVVLHEDLREKDALLSKHIRSFPEESSPLVDTSSRLLKAPRVPTNQSFNPIGHVAIAILPGFSREVGLPVEGVCWIKTFYISWELQGSGLGRETMAYLEELIVREPINAKISALDTVTEEWQFSEDGLQYYVERNICKPPRVSNEGWYKSQGYKVFRSDPAGVHEKTPSGEYITLPLLFLRKELV